jgi:hypothetical protein
MFFMMFYIVRQAFKALGRMFTTILTNPLVHSALDQKLFGSEGKGKNKRSFFEQMGYDLGKGEVAGVEENLPGNEWKYPKDEKDGDEHSDDSKKRKRDRGDGPDLGRGRWN